MIVYQVVFRNQKCRIRRLKVLGEEAKCFRVAGPIALWPSKRTTFKRRRDARRYLSMRNT